MFALPVRVTASGKGKANFFSLLRSVAAKKIAVPIDSEDVEVEIIYQSDAPQGRQIDADNVNKPTLDALKGVAYLDDSQIRSVSSTVFRKNKRNSKWPKVISAHLIQMDSLEKQLMEDLGENVLLIKIYSDSRLRELGGGAKVNKARVQAWFSKELKKPRKPYVHSRN